MTVSRGASRITTNINAPDSVTIRDPKDSTKAAKLDTIAQILVGIDAVHHEIHEGDNYAIHVHDDLANNEALDIVIRAMNDNAKRMHVVFEAEVEAECEFEVFEDPTYVQGSGAAVTAVNRERNSSNTTDAQNIEVNPTITNPGTLLFATMAGSGKKIGGRARGLEEIVLKQDASYIFRITNVSGGGDIWVSPQISWYEHSNE